MAGAPIVVYRPSIPGGRRGTVRSSGRDEVLGTVCSDHAPVVFLDGADAPESVLDDPRWAERW
ncbi:hypothetical protein ACFYZN_29390 [Streptomyces sp. NPDC001777]|uniref:hypothetical protein n=1 Tax=Streptomyces sp. NPDC001777 TaxID=3364608 RepID=UPI00367B5B69